MKPPKFSMSPEPPPAVAPPYQAQTEFVPENAPATETEHHESDSGWSADMDAAPRDGTLLKVKFAPDAPDDLAAEAIWRTTRERRAGRWQVISFWAEPQTRHRYTAEPVCWRMMEGFALPGMLVGP